jgi:transketolase
MSTAATADWVTRAYRVARGVRRRVLEHTIAQQGGYLSQACSSAEILATLYTRVMRLGPSVSPMVPLPFPGVPRADNPNAFTGAGYNGPHRPDLDRFYLSPAHYALVLYATLIEVGRMAPEGLAQFNRDGSTVEMIGAEHSPGMEVTTGSLAQGLSQALGVALARRLRGEGGRTWVFMSDGEFQEGQTWEAFEVIAHHRIRGVGVYVDVNRQQCDGRMADVLDIGDLGGKLRAFGAEVHEVDGHDVELLAQAAESWDGARPLVVLGMTDPCRGIDRLRERDPRYHYVRFRDEAEREAYRALLAGMQEEEG